MRLLAVVLLLAQTFVFSPLTLAAEVRLPASMARTPANIASDSSANDSYQLVVKTIRDYVNKNDVHFYSDPGHEIPFSDIDKQTSGYYMKTANEPYTLKVQTRLKGSIMSMNIGAYDSKWALMEAQTLNIDSKTSDIKAEASMVRHQMDMFDRLVREDMKRAPSSDSALVPVVIIAALGAIAFTANAVQSGKIAGSSGGGGAMIVAAVAIIGIFAMVLVGTSSKSSN